MAVRLFTKVKKKLKDLLLEEQSDFMNQYLKHSLNGEGWKIKRAELLGNDWDKYATSIVNEFNANPTAFLRQPVLSTTVHPNQQVLAEAYLHELQQDDYAVSSILPRLNDIPFGNPYLCDNFPLASPISV